MRPIKNDIVKLTDDFINHSSCSWAGHLSGERLEVMKIDLVSLNPNPVYKIFFKTRGKMLYGLVVDVNGYYIKDDGTVANYFVFDRFGEFDFDDPTPVINTKPISNDSFEANSVCKKCGSPSLDLLFKTECSNPNCSFFVKR